MRQARDWMRAHPVITGLTLTCTLAGGALGFAYLPGEWLGARRIAAGLVSGFGVALFIVAPRMFD